MKHVDFVNEIIRMGIEGARKDYPGPESKLKLEGSIAGFESCYNKSNTYLKELLEQANKKVKAHKGQADYWYYVCFRAEVNWVCNCVSAALVNAGQEPIVPPTVLGVLQAAKILKGDGKWK